MPYFSARDVLAIGNMLVSLMEFLLETPVQVVQDTPKTLQAIVIFLDCLLEVDCLLLLKTPRTSDTPQRPLR